MWPEARAGGSAGGSLRGPCPLLQPGRLSAQPLAVAKAAALSLLWALGGHGWGMGVWWRAELAQPGNLGFYVAKDLSR